MNQNKRILPLLFATTLAGVAVGAFLPSCGGGGAECTLGDTNSCPPDKVCEDIKDAAGKGKAKCVVPTSVAGRIEDARSGGPLGGARIVLWNTQTLTAVNLATNTTSGGNYEIPDMLERKQGTMPRRGYDIRISAPGYLDFPGGVRTSEPFSITLARPDADGIKQTKNYTLQDIAMAPAGRITGTITGGPQSAAALVVAEAGGKGYSSVADLNGNFAIYNLPDGTYEVRGYLKDWSWGPQMVTVAGGEATTSLAGAMASGTVTGQASMATGAISCAQTGTVDVDVVVRSTGEPVPGVRGTVDKMGKYEVTGIPAGTMLVQVSQSGDCLIRDPAKPEFAAGIEHTFAAGETFDASAQVVPLITALQIKHPGAGFEEQFGVDTLRWGYVEGADTYSIEVLDIFGVPLTCETCEVPAAMVSVDNGGTLSVDKLLTRGLHYQWRATAKKMDGTVITKSENRVGQFFRDRT